jgi:tetratricopeptide (TPR) repeat protein
LFAITVLIGSINWSTAASNDAFEQGLMFSHAGQFPEATTAFEEAARAHPASGTFVDLGLAEWQRGHAGPAILAWERAVWIDPYDARANGNLRFARQVADVDAPELKWHEAISTLLPPNAWVWLAGVTLWLGIGLLVVPGVLRRRPSGWHHWLAAMAFGICLFSLTANYGVVSRTHIGFVLGKNATLRLTPTQEGEVVTTLTAGEPARALRTRGDFVFIRAATLSGWIEKRDFGLVCPQ